MKIVSLRPNYFIFIGYLKSGGREGGSLEPLEPMDNSGRKSVLKGP